MERKRLARFLFQDANHYTSDDNELLHLTHFNTNHSELKEEKPEDPYKGERPQRAERVHKMLEYLKHFLPLRGIKKG